MIFKFSDFVNESLGISEASLIFMEHISKRIKEEFIDFYNTTETKRLVKKVSIPYVQLKPLILDKELWTDYPISDLEMTLKFKIRKLPEGLDYTVFGAMNNISNRRHTKLTVVKQPYYGSDQRTLFVKFIIGIDVDISRFDIDTQLEELYDEIKSSVSHELNHGYEFFQRQGFDVNYSKTLDSNIGTVVVKKPDDISTKLFDKWYEITELIYYSEPFEVNATTQETLVYLKDINNIEDKKEVLKHTRGWDICERLTTFNKDDFYDDLLALGKPDDILKLKDDFMLRLKKQLKSQGQLSKSGEYHHKHDVNMLDSFTPKQFIDYFDRIIHKQGERLKRNLIRLITYDV